MKPVDAIRQRLEKPCDALRKHGEWCLHQGKETIDTELVGKADLEGSSLSDWKQVSNRALPGSDRSLVLLNQMCWGVDESIKRPGETVNKVEDAIQEGRGMEKRTS